MKNFFNLKKNINFVASKIRFMLIKIHNKEFRPYISAEKIAIEVERLTKEVAEQMKGKIPLFVSILNGSFMFSSDSRVDRFWSVSSTRTTKVPSL